MKQRGQCKRYDTDHLLDTLDGELLDLQGDLIAVWREEFCEIQDLSGEGGGEENDLSGLRHLLLDTLALIAHALQICQKKISFTSGDHSGQRTDRACCLPRRE